MQTHQITLFGWSQDDQKAFEKLRKSLISAPILGYPDFKKAFIFFTYACDYGVGAELSQKQENGEVVIAYASKHLNSTQQKYATIEKEAYAVIFAIKQFHHYLVGKPFTVISDHRPLQWLAQQKDNTGRLGRWAIKLAAYDYKIVYRPGKIHQNTDCLSRLPVAIINRIIEDNSLIKQHQDADEIFKAMVNCLDNGTLDPSVSEKFPIWIKEIEFFRTIDGVLYRCAPCLKSKRRNEECWQLILPVSLRKEVLKEMHDEPSAGHLAFLRTY